MAEVGELDDLSPMPFGKHMGEPMQDVPASYLHWFYTKHGVDKNSQVYKYITKNLHALKQENPDLIWN